MKPESRSAGFTLIELLVVIGIIGVLAAALLPRILEGQRAANIVADQKNLEWHYANHLTMQQRKFGYKGGGHKMVLSPWIMQVCDHTDANRDRFFTPGLEANDPRYMELSEQPATEIWQNADDLTSDDTHYAGRGMRYLRSMWKPNEVMMSNDNEVEGTFDDGTINVLLSSGSVKPLFKMKELAEYWEEDDPEFFIEVGPNSPVPMLQKLEH